MSWLAGIAGKAENFLNKVDQGAATALQKENIKKIGLSGNKPTTVDDYDSNEKNEARRALLNESVPTSPKKSPGGSKLLPKHTISRRKSRNQKDDDKLLEFLNSTKPATGSKSNVKPPEKFRSKSDDVSKISLDESTAVQKAATDHENRSCSPDAIIIDIDNVTNDKIGIEVSKEIESTNTNHAELSNAAATLEMENKMLKKEMVSLNQEVASAVVRARHSAEEVLSAKRKFETQSNQMSSMEKIMRGLQNKETDLIEVIKAKDSQVAVLRVRIEEVEREMNTKQKLHHSLKSQNERLLQDHSDASGLQSQALDSLKMKLADAESSLQLEKEFVKRANRESADRSDMLEEESQKLAVLLSNAEKQISDEKAKIVEMAEDCRAAEFARNQAVAELSEYKTKAQRILQSKDKLIGNLQEASNENNGGSLTSSLIEMEEIRHERDSLKEELNQSLVRATALQNELAEVENCLQNDLDNLQKQISVNEDQIQQDEMNRKDLVEENNQLKSELRFIRDDMDRMKSSLQSRIHDRDQEIDKLRKQITARSLSTSTEADLEARMHSLTESLIQKQTILEAVSTEKNSLTLQLERLETDIKESRAYHRPTHAIVGLNVADEVKAKVPKFLRESPSDSTVTRKMKTFYYCVDVFSVRVGVFLRKYPIARVFIIFYMLLLHLWVFIVLMTYTPEIHSSQDNLNPGPKI